MLYYKWKTYFNTIKLFNKHKQTLSRHSRDTLTPVYCQQQSESNKPQPLVQLTSTTFHCHVPAFNSPWPMDHSCLWLAKDQTVMLQKKNNDSDTLSQYFWRVKDQPNPVKQKAIFRILRKRLSLSPMGSFRNDLRFIDKLNDDQILHSARQLTNKVSNHNNYHTIYL
jgi:hypothetical protein